MHTYASPRWSFPRDTTPLIMPNALGAPMQPEPSRRPSTSIVFHYLRDSHRSHDRAIAPHATDCPFDLADADPARVDSHVAPGTATMRRAARAHETGLTENTRVPWDAPQGTLVPCVTTPQLDQLDVVAPPLHVYQKSGEGGPVDDVSAALRAPAVTNCGNAGQVGGHLNATAVVRAERGFSPNSLRQVDH
jgi:hypothetical protein